MSRVCSSYFVRVPTIFFNSSSRMSRWQPSPSLPLPTGFAVSPAYLEVCVPLPARPCSHAEPLFSVAFRSGKARKDIAARALSTMYPPSGVIVEGAGATGARLRRGRNSIGFVSRILVGIAILVAFLSTASGTPAAPPDGDPRKELDQLVESSEVVGAGPDDLDSSGLTEQDGHHAGIEADTEIGSTSNSTVLEANKARAAAVDFEDLPKREILSCNDLDPGRTIIVAGAVYFGGDIICTEPRVKPFGFHLVRRSGRFLYSTNWVTVHRKTIANKVSLALSHPRPAPLLGWAEVCLWT